VDFMKHASGFMLDHDCRICAFAIAEGDPVYWTADVAGHGDHETVKVTVHHALCHRAVERAMRAGKAKALKAAYEEAARLISDTSPSDAIAQCHLRANAAAKEVYTILHSGVDVESALFQGLIRQ
jgi:hypothetical protein